MRKPVTDGNQFDPACFMFSGEEQPFQSGIMVVDVPGFLPDDRVAGV
jgi:hypothetical protein